MFPENIGIVFVLLLQHKNIITHIYVVGVLVVLKANHTSFNITLSRFIIHETLLIKQSIFLFIFLFGVGGCASYKHGKINVRSVDSYMHCINSEGISVAADSYDSTEKAKEGFYIDTTSEGFYPINLIIQNNTGDRIIILRETIELIDVNENTYNPIRSTVMAETFEHNKMAYALLGFGIFSYASAEEANRKMASDWKEKELPDQLIILDRRKKNGFLYFQLPKGQTTKGYKLKLEVEKLSTKEVIPLEILL